MKRFVTCSINRVVDIVDNTAQFKRFKYAVECEDISKAYEVASYLNGVDGVQYIRICKTNKDKSRILLSQEGYIAM
jgi:hypothetical protein